MQILQFSHHFAFDFVNLRTDVAKSDKSTKKEPQRRKSSGRLQEVVFCVLVVIEVANIPPAGPAVNLSFLIDTIASFFAALCYDELPNEPDRITTEPMKRRRTLFGNSKKSRIR